MVVSDLYYICLYCVFTLWGRSASRKRIFLLLFLDIEILLFYYLEETHLNVIKGNFSFFGYILTKLNLIKLNL